MVTLMSLLLNGTKSVTRINECFYKVADQDICCTTNTLEDAMYTSKMSD